MCKDHPKRRELNCPDWLKKEWRGGGSMSKDEVADILRQANFNKDCCLKILFWAYMHS
jgi:hypothetical protein